MGACANAATPKLAMASVAIGSIGLLKADTKSQGAKLKLLGEAFKFAPHSFVLRNSLLLFWLSVPGSVEIHGVPAELGVPVTCTEAIARALVWSVKVQSAASQL